jgi:hypothetical protein
LKRFRKDPVVAWNRIPIQISNALQGLKEADLDLRGGGEGWSIRETVHHLVEANLVAATMIIAALATNGGNFDWTWVNPSAAWMRRVGYDAAKIGPALKALRELCLHISALLSRKPDALERKVKLNDAPRAPRYVMTVESILRQEVEHVKEHLRDIREIRQLNSC